MADDQPKTDGKDVCRICLFFDSPEDYVGKTSFENGVRWDLKRKLEMRFWDASFIESTL